MFDKVLTKLMNEYSINQMKLSRELGIPQTTISNYVLGRTTPSIPALVAIASKFGVSTDFLAGISPIEHEYTARINKLSSNQIETIDAMLSLFERQNMHDSGDEPIRNLPEDIDSDESSIYFLYSPNSKHVKIGYSANPKSRISSIATSAPFELVTLAIIPGTRSDERALHERFSHLRNHREWFEAVPELLDYIESVTPSPSGL